MHKSNALLYSRTSWNKIWTYKFAKILHNNCICQSIDLNQGIRTSSWKPIITDLTIHQGTVYHGVPSSSGQICSFFQLMSVLNKSCSLQTQWSIESSILSGFPALGHSVIIKVQFWYTAEIHPGTSYCSGCLKKEHINSHLHTAWKYKSQHERRESAPAAILYWSQRQSSVEDIGPTGARWRTAAWVCALPVRPGIRAAEEKLPVEGSGLPLWLLQALRLKWNTKLVQWTFTAKFHQCDLYMWLLEVTGHSNSCQWVNKCQRSKNGQFP